MRIRIIRTLLGGVSIRALDLRNIGGSSYDIRTIRTVPERRAFGSSGHVDSRSPLCGSNSPDLRCWLKTLACRGQHYARPYTPYRPG